MQAVILAAGQSTRTFPLTITRPKPLLLLANKTLLEHKLDMLQGIVKEVIIVVGYKKEMIEEKIGKAYHGLSITYVEQKEQKGTGHALSLVKKHIKGKFLVMMGDDWYGKSDIENCLHSDYAILVSESMHPQDFGVIEHNTMQLKNIIEKPTNPQSNLINTGLYVLQESIFDYLNEVKMSERGDIEFPPALVDFAQESTVQCVKAKEYFSIGYPWDLLRVDEVVRKGKNSISKSAAVTLPGRVENSSIGDGCIIKGVVKNSIIMPNSTIEEGSTIENSIVGYNVAFKGTAKAAKTTSKVNGKQIDAGVFGTAIGDGVHASSVDIMPGCKIWPNKTITGTIHEDIH